MYQYLQQLHAIVTNQQRKIEILEKTISTLAKELEELKQKPIIHVEKMEYKFDQLKVETLEGTLNIGLNPSDSEAIEDFAVQNGVVKPNHDPKQMFQKGMEVEEELYNYLDSELPGVMNQVAEKMNRSVDEQYLTFIKDDIKRQIPTRAQYYLQKFPQPDNPQEKDQWRQSVLQQFSKEMENGIRTFLTNLPNQMKG